MKSLILTLIFISACSSKPYVVKNITSLIPTNNQIVYVVSHGWHTGFIIPTKIIQSKLPQLTARFGNTPYIEFGWGDQGFYQAQKITLGLALKAMFWPTKTVIHAVAVPEKVETYFQHSKIIKLCLNGKEYSFLVQFIVDSFHKTAKDSILKLKKGIYGDSQFYKGVGYYYIFNTCNKWTAKGLKSLGMDISPIFKLTANSIMDIIQNSACVTE